MAALGIRVERAEPGYAVARMRVRPDMVNGVGVTHGGMIFTLADTVIAMASNDSAAASLVAGADVAFLSPSHEGDELVAVAERRTLAGRTGLYDARVETAGRVVAEVRGRVRMPRETR
nr:hotdog fold thioesterase [Microbacterium aquimaris]